MKKRIIQVNFTPDRVCNSKFDKFKKRMHIVRCVCGCEILVLPDLEAMNHAIKNHIAEHKKGLACESILSLSTIETFLTKQVLIKINLEFAKDPFSALSNQEETGTPKHSLKN